MTSSVIGSTLFRSLVGLIAADADATGRFEPDGEEYWDGCGGR